MSFRVVTVSAERAFLAAASCGTAAGRMIAASKVKHASLGI